MPIASAIAPASVAAGNPAATAPKATPTASPSGKLCRVMAVTSSTLRCQVVLIPSACSISSPRCRCGRMRSTTHRNAPPSRNPTTAGIQPGTPLPSDISMAGASSDQKLAAIITPAAKPSMAFSSERLTFLVRKTVAAPAAVIP